MPYPQNVQTAKEVEKIIREQGAIPATIAIIDQKIHVGLSEENLEKLGVAGKKAYKTSRRDIAYTLAKPDTFGATTVSATMLVADLVGIKVFATGGIGGVHRGATETMDISADLTELGRTSVTVVCAGAKSILDIGLTMEFLETQGVTVIGYKTDMVPAFFVPSSGIPVHVRLDSIDEIASLIYYNTVLNLHSGVVVSCPIPDEYVSDAQLIQKNIEDALTLAEEQHISGKQITPFLLAKVNELSKGASLKANIHLVKNNAKIASQIAKSYASKL